MNISIITVGKLKEKYFKDASTEYLKRLSRFGKIDVIEIPDEKIPDNVSEKQKEQIIIREGTAILEKVKNGSFFVALCIEGKELSSEELAEKIGSLSMQTSSITFAIGGSLGLSEEVKRAAQLRISFGKITLPHQLARIILLEQVYRAFKINANETYHK